MNAHHKINYIELPAADLEAMKKFYGDAFGWTFTDYGPEYVEFKDGAMTGGFTSGTPSGGTGPLVILFSEDLEASLSQVQSSGGTIVKPIYSFPGGRRFHFADPSGNQLAIWSNT